ncbi:hypothetical protein lerEdw1_004133 [Lerista edwardsae]|nr:hypothetical protein lerEdw1_004133 [Lerista edwardsae]
MGSVVKAGSNFPFCCVAKKTEIVHGFSDGRDHFTDKRQRKVLFLLENMHAPHVACLTSDKDNPLTQSYVIGLPHKPNSFSCEIERRLTLSCSWKTNEKKHPYYYPDGLCETELILSNVNYTKTYCNQTLKEEHRCSFPIRETRIPKLRLTARNCFGESHTDYDFYENHKAPSGQLDIWRDIRPGLDKRNVTIFWKRSLDFRDNGNIHTYEIRWEKVDDPAVADNRSLLPKFNSTTIFLDYDSYKISVSAKNVVNSSSPSVMIISKTAGNENIQETKDVKIKGTSEGISVSWQPQARFDGYVVDWCSYPQSHPSDFQWEKFGGNHSSAVIKSDAFRFNVTYIFRVYGSLNNTTDLLEKALYLKECDFLFGSLLLLAIVPIMLIICICFWKSSCIRKRCFPTIPRPDISPFLKLNLGTMKICDVAPDKLDVMENHQISKGKQSGLGMLITENITYFDPDYYLNLQEQEAESNKLNPPLTSYKPLQDVFPVNSLSTSYKPHQDFFCNQTHQPYISLE